MDDYRRLGETPDARYVMEPLAMMRAVLVVGTLWLASIPAEADAATIYLCRGYGGGEFWSSVHCQKKSAVIVRMATVPDGVPFEQQVRMVEGHLQQSNARSRNEDREREQLQQCAQLKAERDGIWSRYSNWQFQQGEVIGQDRTRWQVIEAEQRRLNCQQR